MYKSFRIIFFYLVAFFFLIACSKPETPQPNGSGSSNIAAITVVSESNIEETSFTANWTVNKSDINSIKLQIALTDKFENLIKDISVPLTSNSFNVTGLTGVTTYYYKIVINFSDNTSITSSIQSVNTRFEFKEVSFTTSDGYKLSGELAYLASNTTIPPAVIMMHELGQNRYRWTFDKYSNLRTKLIAEGYACLCFSFRGHGGSDEYDQNEIRNDLSIVSKDMIAAIDFMKTNEEVNGNKLALVGASLGGIMAITGNGYEEVKTSVAISPIRHGIYTIFKNLMIRSVFYIAGSKNKMDIEYGGSKEESIFLHNLTHHPKKITIVNSDAHGVDLLNDAVETDIVVWINSQIDL